MMFPHGLSAVPLLIHQTSVLPAMKRNTSELAISSWVHAIIISLLGDVTSVTYSCGICGLSSVESDSCFSESDSIDLSLESPHGFGEVTFSQDGLGKGICSFCMFCVVRNLPFFCLVLTARSSEGRVCIDIPVQLFSCWRCWNITGSCGKPSLLCVCVGSSLAHGATGSSQITCVRSAPTALAASYIANSPRQVIF